MPQMDGMAEQKIWNTSPWVGIEISLLPFYFLRALSRMKSLLDKSADFFLSRISHGVSISIMYFYGISFIFGRYESRRNKYESRMKTSMHFKVCGPFPKRYFFMMQISVLGVFTLFGIQNM